MIRYFITILFILPTFCLAADWSSNRLEYLYGTSFADTNTKETNIQMDTLTFEHVSGWKYGDNFLFSDLMDVGGKKKISAYTEWSPRFSLNKILGTKEGVFIKDILLALCFEFPSGQKRNDLIGIGADLTIPGFNFFSTALYSKHSKSNSENKLQLSIAWEATFSLGIDLKFAGFFDYETKSDSSEANFITQPQILWVAKKTFEAGLELHIWQNKYGIKDVNETVPQVLLRWNL